MPGCNLFISTIPRSGTHYIQQLFFALSKLAGEGEEKYLALRKSSSPSIAKNQTLGLNLFAVGHLLCPRIMKSFSENKLAQWESLGLFSAAYNSFVGVIQNDAKAREFVANNGGFDPENKNARFVLIYRNPLDQMVSYYKHAQNHVDPTLQGYTNSQGDYQKFDDLSDFIFNGALDAYIKYYLSYVWSLDRYGERIKMIAYERLRDSPFEVLSEILVYAESNPAPSQLSWQIKKAIHYCQPEQLKALERAAGSTMANDQKQTERENSHIRDGGTGSWRRFIDGKTVDRIEKRLNEFDLSLADFKTK